MFGKFSEDAQKTLLIAKKEMIELKHDYIGSEHILLSLLKSNNDIIKKLKKYNVDYKKFKEKIIDVIGYGNNENNYTIYSSLVKRILENLIIDSKETSEEITSNSIFLSIINEAEGTAIRLLLSMNVDINKLYIDVCNNKSKKKVHNNLTIEQLADDLTKKAKEGLIDPVIGREDEINRTIEILCRRCKNNPLLIGSAGVGKTAIVEELSRRIFNGNVPYSLKNKRILSLDMASLVSGTKYRGEFEERVKKIIKELDDNDDIILFIDEIHTLSYAGGAEGAIDASNIFKPYLARGKIKVIGATTIEEYKKYIEKDNALDRRFQKVYINEPNKETLKEILMKLKTIYECFHFVKVSEKIIDDIIYLSDRYIFERCEPDRSIDILDEVCTKVSLKEEKEELELDKLIVKLNKIKQMKNESIINQNYDKAYEYKEEEKLLTNSINEIKLKIINKKRIKKVTKSDVLNIISKRTKIPLNELNNDIKQDVNNMEKVLKDNIIGQDIAINKLIEITKKIKLDIKDKNKSYSLLFCGPTGVGKTFLASTFAKELVGEDNIIKLDMSEYSESISINKLIGSPAGYVGYEDNKNIFEQIRNKPYSVLILDEIEKAHKSIINLFLSILDEGKCKDSYSREINFNNVVIIMTSNAYVSKDLMGFNKTKKSNTLEEFFSKEFINRIDEIISFNSFTKEDIDKIILKEANNLYKKYGKENILKLETIDKIIEESDYQKYGVRRLCKIVRKEIENEILTSVFS